VVAFDEHSAEPHHIPLKYKSGRRVLLVDMGARFMGYCSDLTRVFIKDRIPLILKVYNIVKSAQNRAIRKVRPGVKIADIDSEARSYIDSKGYGRFFLHSLGHGVGVDVHELPFISKQSDMILEENMVFTIEPGIYLKDQFGVRIEDTVVLKSSGAIILENL